ncbi:SRPBCC domain-containing protein [Rhabdothermincola salaria]|uniref:SRPBCC domain-containing protein n=1 Tax=Rhabdothermincola salaria TaxID=2903142 RepID=UPI001E5F9166|nr:SRPBCC domain-containing protein [Rhabdothermincola salaria]MCD9623976.1 SRPBCC domain-containing protein [Rhabdothermincola salaria]
MRHQIRTQIDIDATPDEVYAVVADVAAYPEWNPTIVETDGHGRLGEKLRLRMQPTQGGGMTFRPTVTEAEPGVAFEWLGRLGVPGLFDGRHRFELTDLGDGRTRLVHGESFSGLLVRPLRRMLDDGTAHDFEVVNAAIAQRVAERRGVGAHRRPGPEAPTGRSADAPEPGRAAGLV